MRSRTLFVAALACLVIGPVALGAESTPAIAPGQLEADWRRQDELRFEAARSVTKKSDAAGACDGVKNGQWGFHTLHEKQPWWQVDLGDVLPLGRMVLYNRCGDFAARSARIMVLISDDGASFHRVYQHDGTTFHGHSDGKPLAIDLSGRDARIVRLQLPGTDYFHLDEVEIFDPEGKTNLALRRPATQSSTSQWSVAHSLGGSSPRDAATDRVIERGLQLARDLRRRGADVDDEVAALESIARRLRQLPATAADDTRRELYRRARLAVRRLALANPQLDFDEILFVKRAPGMFPHVSDQYYGWWSRGGGGIYVLSGFKGDRPTVRCITESWPRGNFLRPELSWDGTKVLFAWCKHYPHVAGMEKVDKEKLPEDAFYHVWEMNVDGTGARRLTRGYYDDFDARYLPGGDIVFLSTRKGQALQVSRKSTAATTASTRPDSYVRCGGDNRRPVAVFTLHRMNGDGGDLRPISAFENFEWTPSVADDGRVLYARWDYIDRFNGHFMSLWSTNPDGTSSQLVYGNYTKKPQCIFEARSVPGSQRLLFTATAHHSNTGGSLVLLDPRVGNELERPLTRLTPEVCFPETEGWPSSYYAGPHPLSEEHFIVAWSDRRLPAHTLMQPDDPRNPRNALGIYLFDAWGNLTLLHRDPEISSMNPIPIRPRARPAAIADTVDWDGAQEGRFVLQDVYEGLDGVERGTIERLRVIGVPPKVQPHMNRPSLGVSREDPGKFVLGTVPVEKDGSAHFRVPSGIPVFFQALDADGVSVQTMRSLTYVQPNETLSCVGCHESRDSTPPAGRVPIATMRPPSRLKPAPSGSWPLRFDELVGPVLNARCVSCHEPGAEDAVAAKLDLTPARAYATLMSWRDGELRKLAFEKDRSTVGDSPSRKSRLLALLTADDGHHGVRLDANSRERLATWLDTYAQRLGTYSAEQERDLRALRQQLATLLEE